MKRAIILNALMFLAGLSPAIAQGTAFTYQGRLTDGGNPANGTYDFRSGLYVTSTGGTAVGGLVTNPAVVVSNGLFTISLDFSNVFDGTTYWLQIGVRTNGGAAFTPVLPRQELTPAPYAIFAEGASAAGLSGTLPSASLSGGYGGAVSFTNPGDSFAGNGAGLANVNAATLNGLAASNFWQLGGNTISGASQFLGTLNNQPLDFYANGVRAMRLILRTDAGGMFSNAPNVIGGSSVNLVKTGVIGGTVAGGGGMDTNGVSYPNQVNANFGAISGGGSNNITGVGIFSFIGGGQGNTVNQGYGTISGGLQNTINNAFATLGGGYQNLASGPETVVGGGAQNAAVGFGATVAGGGNNFASGINAGYATVSGGYTNVASGDYATVSGGQNNNANGMNSSIGGGWINTAGGSYAVVGGGSDNKASHLGATVGGGSVNTASGGAVGYATVSGGYANTASGTYATVAGGDGNTASGDHATVGGGDQNIASGTFSFAAGYQAEAKHDGSFVWADDAFPNSYFFASTTTNQFRVRSTGGAEFVTAIDSAGAATAGVRVVAGGTSWSAVCDRNAKKNFQPVDTVAVLDKLAAVPIEQWNYKWEADTATPNLGPMAQDFKAAFYPGRDDKSISTLEFDGVELAAIQGLNQKLEERARTFENQLQQKDAQIQQLQKTVDELKNIVSQLAAKKGEQ